MERYFFDIIGHQRSGLDYVGQVLPTANEAYDWAETMAFDLAVGHADEPIGAKSPYLMGTDASFSQFRSRLAFCHPCQ
jgi:hypothetical protein